MVEIIAAIAQWVQLTANLIILGSCIFIAIANLGKRAYSDTWIKKVESLFPWLAVSIPISLIVILMTMLLQVTEIPNNLKHWDIWTDFIQDTRVGQVWIWRFAAALLLLAVALYLCRKTEKLRKYYVLCAVVAALPLIAGSLTSHIAAEEFSISSIAPYVLHLILAGVWFGALPALLLLVYDRSKNGKSIKSNLFEVETLKRFSTIALAVMPLIVLTGILAADRLVENYYATLVATPYGWLLSSKIFLLGIILIIAFSVRSHWLPLLTSKESIDATRGRIGLKKWVRIELLLALALVFLATLVADTTPGKYAVIEEWFFPFRFSITATWDKPNVALQVWIGIAFLILAAFMVLWGRSHNWALSRLVSISALTCISGVAIALPPLTIEAYPETYRKPSVPFDVISISNGAILYTQHCVECHGLQGMGNGIKSRTLSTKLPDLLIEPHTTEHTPGDFYNWITSGMKNTEMSGYADKLSDEDRWDLINYIHALSRGYQARILSPDVMAGRVFAKPPLFSFADHNDDRRTLQEFREKQQVLLVLFSWPQSHKRLEQLRQAYEQLRGQNTVILAVPTKVLNNEELEQVTSVVPFPVIVQGREEIANSYMLWRRTMSHPDIIGRGTYPDHIEFLLDKSGYLRARWVPSYDQSGWSNIDALFRQVNQLNKEQAKFPFPEEFVR